MFEIVSPPIVDFTAAANGENDYPAHVMVEVADRTDGSPRKIVLPRRSGQPRLGPQPYYYHASRTGVLPSLCSVP